MVPGVPGRTDTTCCPQIAARPCPRPPGGGRLGDVQINRRRDLRSDGYSDDEIERMVASGRLVRLRRGLYTSEGPDDPAPEAGHLRRTHGLLAAMGSGYVVSHTSAAVVRELPAPRSALTQVHLSRQRTGGGKRRAGVVVHTSPLPVVDVGVHEGLLVTTVPRTFVDVARQVSAGWAVALGDEALRRGSTRTEIDATIGRMAGWPGVARARRAAALLDRRSESVGESLSRVLLVQAGLAPTELQLPVLDGRGELVGRVDFAWPEHRVIGEFDGRAKYDRDDPQRSSSGDVVWAEKIREDRLRDEGWLVVRWTWADLWRPGLVETRVRQAFRRSGTP